MRVKIRPVAALSERQQDTFEAHERGLSGRLSARCCSRGQEDETEQSSDRQRWGKMDQPDGEKQKPQHPQPTEMKKEKKNPTANKQKTVTESIIYFRTLDLSLRFLGR